MHRYYPSALTRISETSLTETQKLGVLVCMVAVVAAWKGSVVKAVCALLVGAYAVVFHEQQRSSRADLDADTDTPGGLEGATPLALYQACAPHTSPIHRLYIAYTSPIHRLYIAYTSPCQPHFLFNEVVSVIMRVVP